MTGFNHGLNGAVIALVVKNPAAAIVLSFASHYVTDIIPHFGFAQSKVLGKAFNNYLKFDFLFAIFLMIGLALLFPQHKFIIWACMIVAAAPDAIWWFYRKNVKDWPKGLGKFTRLHFRINNDVAHVDHYYFDAIWFVATSVTILIIKY